MSKLITEQQIEAAVDWLEIQDESFEITLSQLRENQPMILAYLLSEHTHVLTKPEREYLLFLALSIWKSLELANKTEGMEEIDENIIGEFEEAQWELWSESRGRDFSSKLDIFFENTTQEELLAFVEDALEEEGNEDWLTPEGREAIFIFMATLINVFDRFI